MPLKLEAIDHVQVTVPRPVEREALRFYDTVLGLERITKPEPLAPNGGAWYRLGALEVHLSPEDDVGSSRASKRHVRFLVPDLKEAESELARRVLRPFRIDSRLRAGKDSTFEIPAAIGSKSPSGSRRRGA